MYQLTVVFANGYKVVENSDDYVSLAQAMQVWLTTSEWYHISVWDNESKIQIVNLFK